MNGMEKNKVLILILNNMEEIDKYPQVLKGRYVRRCNFNIHSINRDYSIIDTLTKKERR